MPTQNVAPQIFMSESETGFKDLVVYHVYKNDCFEDGVREFWFSFSISCSDDGGAEEGTFDIRDLPGRPASMKSEDIKALIKAAIDDGHFKGWHWDDKPEPMVAIPLPAAGSRRFAVSVQKTMYVTGKIVIDARSDGDAVKRINQMLRGKDGGLRTTDPRINWGDPVYEDESFDTTGDVDEVGAA